MTQKNFFDRSKHQLGSTLKKQGLAFEGKDESEIFFGHPKYNDKFGLKELIQGKQQIYFSHKFCKIWLHLENILKKPHLLSKSYWQIMPFNKN
uniref:Uncharacterized protein n=1 Tax=Megaselia scalaris TaxID=36166 RepID=T1GAD9_MEGSC